MLSIAILMLSPPPLPPSVRAGLQQPAQHDCPGSCHKAGGSQADVFQRLGSPHFLMFSAVWRLDSHATGRTMSTFSIYSPGVSDAVSYGPQATASGARCPRQAFSLHLRARRALRRRRQLLQGRAEGVPCSAADQVQEREGRGVVARAPGAQFPNLEVMARLSTSAAPCDLGNSRAPVLQGWCGVLRQAEELRGKDAREHRVRASQFAL